MRVCVFIFTIKLSSISHLERSRNNEHGPLGEAQCNIEVIEWKQWNGIVCVLFILLTNLHKNKTKDNEKKLKWILLVKLFKRLLNYCSVDSAVIFVRTSLLVFVFHFISLPLIIQLSCKILYYFSRELIKFTVESQMLFSCHKNINI